VSDAGEPRPEDFESRLVATRWHAWIPLDDGRRVRIVASMGAFPPARVEVEERPASLVITLFERRPPRLSPDGIEYGIFDIAITASFDIMLPTRLRGRRLIDGVTGFDPNTVKPDWRRDPVKALAADVTEPRVEVPLGRSFDWKELTGRAWFDPGTSEHEPSPPPAEILFFSSSEDVPDRERPEGG
jgi:hypothetical protein